MNRGAGLFAVLAGGAALFFVGTKKGAAQAATMPPGGASGPATTTPPTTSPVGPSPGQAWANRSAPQGTLAPPPGFDPATWSPTPGGAAPAPSGTPGAPSYENPPASDVQSTPWQLPSLTMPPGIPFPPFVAPGRAPAGGSAAKPAASVSAPAVTVPAGYAAVSPDLVPPEIAPVIAEIAGMGDPPGTVYPFDFLGQSYAVLISATRSPILLRKTG